MYAYTVSEGAIIKRINRRLAKDGMKLKRPRGHWIDCQWYPDSYLGEFYVLDVDHNWITSTDVDLESYGRELGVLDEGESLAK